MRLIMTAQQVLDVGFSRTEQTTINSIKDIKIDAAQEKYIKPAIGKALYQAVLSGAYPTLVNDYIAPALALFVRYTVMPDIATKFNDMGAQLAYGNNASSATSKDRAEARLQVRDDAQTLLNKAVEYIRENAADFPEFDVRHIERPRAKRMGGLVL